MKPCLEAMTADATPHASSLIQSLRDIGYSCETALADIIDNSITAGARAIEILSDVSGGEPALAVLDDGAGMTLLELVEAMRPGSRNGSGASLPRRSSSGTLNALSLLSPGT